MVLAVGPHDRGALDVYDALLEALDVEVPDEERTKPPCCDEVGAPPVDVEVAERLVAAVERLARRRGGRRRAP